jgi:hypothetical protein
MVDVQFYSVGNVSTIIFPKLFMFTYPLKARAAIRKISCVALR